MSTEIDKRVVEMRFDNKDFEKNVQKSLTTIDKLKMALDFDGGKGFDTLTKAANKMDLSNVGRQMDQVQAKFSTFQIAGYTMIQELTKAFIGFGKNIWNSTLGQIKSGGMSRALKIEQAEFKMKALAKNMFDASLEADVLEGKINGLMSKMGTAIDNAVTGTAYGYDAAADVASQLMASGVRDAEKMESYLKGVAGAAAMTGNSFEQLGHVFTTVASNGKLMTMQLRQFSTYGLNLSATLAQQLGKSEAQINEMVTDGKISFEQFADALSEAYGDAAQKADDTFAGVTTNIKAQLSRLGQRFAKPFIENSIPMLKEVKQAIKNISAALAPMADRFNKSFGYLTNWLRELISSKDFKKTEAFFRGLENIIYGVVLVLHSLYNAVKRVFPTPFTKTLFEISKGFLEFSQNILPTEQALKGIENVFVMLLIPLKKGAKLLGYLVKFINPLTSLISGLVNGLFELFSFTKPLLDYVVDFINKNNLIEKGILLISNSIAVLIMLIKSAISIIALVVYQISQLTSLDEIVDVLKTLGSVAFTAGKYLLIGLGAPIALIYAAIMKLSEILPGFFSDIIEGAKGLYNSMVPLISDVINALKTGDISKIKDRFESFLWDLERYWKRFDKKYGIGEKIIKFKKDLSEVANVIVKITTVIKERLKTLTAAQLIFGGFGVAAIFLVLSLVRLNDAFQRFILTVRQVPFLFTRINQTLKSFNKYIAPSILITSFALAIGVLAISLKKISEIPENDLQKAAKAIAVFGGALMVFAFIMMKSSTITSDAGKIVTVLNPASGTILAIALSTLVLAQALRILGGALKDMDNIGQSLTVLVEIMLVLTATMIGLAKLAPALQVSSFAFTSFAIATYTLTKALIALSEMEKEVSSENLAAILSLMLGLGLAIAVTAKATAGGALAIFSFSVSLVLILTSITLFMNLPWDAIQNGMERAREIFELFLPLIIAIGAANKLSAAANAINISSGIGGLVLSIGAFMLMYAVFIKIIESIDSDTLDHAEKALGMVAGSLLIMTGIMMGIHVASEVFQRMTLDATRNVTLISRSVADMSILIVAMGASMILMGLAAKVMSEVPWWGIVEVLVAFIIISDAMTDLVRECKSLQNVDVKPMLGMIATVISILGSMALLTFAAKDDPTAVMVAAGAVTLALAGLAALMYAMKGFQKQSRQVNTNVASATDEILALMALLGLVVFMMVYVTDKIYYEQDIYAFDATMGVLMLGMIGIALAAAAVMKILNSIRIDDMVMLGQSKLWALMGMFSLVMLAMMSVAGSMAIVGTIESTKLESSVKVVGLIAAAVLGIMLLMGGILWLIKKMNIKPTAFLEVGAGVALAAMAIMEIAGAMAIMSNLTDPETLSENAQAVATLLAEVGLLMIALVALDRNYDGATVSNVGLALLAAAGGIVAIAAAFALLESVHANPDNIMKYAEAIGIVIGVLLIGGAILTKVASVSLGAIPVLQSLAWVFGTLGVALLGSGIILLGIAENFKVFRDATEDTVNTVVDNMLVFAKRIPEIIASLAFAIMESGPAIGMAIASVFVFIFTAVGTALSLSISSLLESFNMILRAIIDWLGSDETIDLIHDATYVMGQVLCEGVIDGALDYINDNPKVQKLSTAIFDMFNPNKVGDIDLRPKRIQEMDKTITNLEEYSKIFSRIEDNLEQAQQDAFYKNADSFAEQGRYIATVLADGIDKGKIDVEEATSTLAAYGLEGLEFMVTQPKTYASLEEMGNYFVEGLNKGIQDGYLSFEQATSILALHGLEGFADRLQIHSPSLEMIKMGKFTVAGVIEGIKNGEYTFSEVMATLAEAGVSSFSNIFTDANLLKNFGLGSKVLTREDLLASGGAWHYDQQLGDYVQAWQEAGYDSLEDYVEKHLADQSAGFNLLEQILGGFKSEDLMTDFDLSGLTKSLDSVGDEAEDAAKRLEDLIEKMLSTLDIFTEFSRKTEMTSKDVFKTFIGQFEGVGEWTDMLVDLANRGLSAGILTQLEEEGPKSYERVHALYQMTDKQLAMINALYSDTDVLAKKSITSIDKAIENSVKDDRRLVLDNLLDKEDLNLSGIQKEVEETSYSFEKFDDDIRSVLEQLYELQKKGNVNLLMRPAIDTSELNNAGYDAGDGFATMFTSTFSNETEDVAMNFTPIMVDPKTGKYLGVMSPDEFDSYCQDVVDGVKKDDLNLKVGMTFNGKDAIEKATQTAEQIHELHEQLGENWGEDQWSQIDVNTIVRPIAEDASEYVEKETSSILDTLENFGRDAITILREQLRFEEALEGVKEFRDELSDTISGAMSIFDELTEEEEISSVKMLHNMTDQVKRVGRWSTYISQLAARGMSEGLLNELKELGPAGYTKVESFIKMTDAQLSRANSLYESSSKVGKYGADKIVSSYANAGFNASLGFKEGVDPYAAEEVMYQLANHSLSSLEEALDINSPSLKMKQDGIYALQGFILGLQDENTLAGIDDATSVISSKVKDSLDAKTIADKFLTLNSLLNTEEVYEPVIRPVWDMSAVQDGYSYIENMLNTRPIRVNAIDMASNRQGPSQDAVMITNAINNLAADQRAIRQEISSLRTDTVNLGNRIDGMYVRLDGNALVGQIVNPMDKAMGAKVVKQRRMKG